MNLNPSHGNLNKERRYIYTYTSVIQNNSNATAPTAARVYLSLFDIRSPILADQITIYNGGTAAGNVTVGIYGPLVIEDTCAGSPLAATSTSTAQTGTNQIQNIAFTFQTMLNPGRYYTAIEFSSVLATFWQNYGNDNFPGWMQYYARGGGYGALTDPCPTITNATSLAMPISIVRNLI